MLLSLLSSGFFLSNVGGKERIQYSKKQHCRNCNYLHMKYQARNVCLYLFGMGMRPDICIRPDICSFLSINATIHTFVVNRPIFLVVVETYLHLIFSFTLLSH
jgi:hypothetical protein